jgi:hypothetical protein
LFFFCFRLLIFLKLIVLSKIVFFYFYFIILYLKSPKITLTSTKFQTTKLYVSTATTTKLSTATTSTFTTNLITTKPTTLLTLNITAAPLTVTNCRSIVYQYTPNITALKNTTTTCRTFCWAAVSKMFFSNKNIKIIHIFSSFLSMSHNRRIIFCKEHVHPETIDVIHIFK